jgi:hypothetical protein
MGERAVRYGGKPGAGVRREGERGWRQFEREGLETRRNVVLVTDRYGVMCVVQCINYE